MFFIIKKSKIFLVVWYLKVFESANTLFEYDYLTYFFAVKIFVCDGEIAPSDFSHPRLSSVPVFGEAIHVDAFL